MNSIFRDGVDGHCWCGKDHAPYEGQQHRIDTSDLEWPMGNTSCICGGGAWGVAHHVIGAV